jgi:metal-sulfur cluster biosynthetic enzyme
MVVLEDERTALADEKVHGTMTLTIMGCPLPDMLSEDIDRRLRMPEVDRVTH